jgi:hypothetical protein
LANNRQLHRSEFELIEENAEGFARQLELCEASAPCSENAIAQATNALVLQAGRQVDKDYALATEENVLAREYLVLISPEGYIPSSEGTGIYVDENQEWFSASEDQFSNTLINLETISANPDLYRLFANVQSARDGNIDTFITTLVTTNAADEAGDLSPSARIAAAKDLLMAFNNHLDAQPEQNQEIVIIVYGQLAQAAVRNTLVGMTDADWDLLSLADQEYVSKTILESYVSTLGVPGGQAAPRARVRLPGGQSAALSRAPNGEFKYATNSRPSHLTSHPDAHTVGRHGPQVTDQQLEHRALTGVAPDGTTLAGNRLPPLSSAFHTDRAMLRADAAVRGQPLQDKIAANPNAVSHRITVDVGEDVGRGYRRLGSGNPSNIGRNGPPQRVDGLNHVQATVTLNPTTGVWETLTMFPTLP